jgi:hypothetical protein
MIHGWDKIRSPNYSKQIPAPPTFLLRESITVHFSACVGTMIPRRVTRTGAEAIASRIMPENMVERLDDGAKGDAGQADTDEVGVLVNC